MSAERKLTMGAIRTGITDQEIRKTADYVLNSQRSQGEIEEALADYFPEGLDTLRTRLQKKLEDIKYNPSVGTFLDAAARTFGATQENTERRWEIIERLQRHLQENSSAITANAERLVLLACLLRSQPRPITILPIIQDGKSILLDLMDDEFPENAFEIAAQTQLASFTNSRPNRHNSQGRLITLDP